MDSTTSNLPKFYKCQYGIVELLTDYNYPDWSTTLIQFLTADETWDIVQGTTARPPPLPANASAARRQAYNEEHSPFKVLAAKACSMILSACSLSKKRSILGKTNPKDMWDTLKAQNDSASSKAGPFRLRSQFFQEKCTEDGPISTFLSKLGSYQIQLSSTLRAIPDDDMISYVLSENVLPKRFEQTIKYLRLQAHELSWNDLVQTLINEDIELRANSVSSTNPITSPLTAAIANSKKRRNSKSQENSKKKRKLRSISSDSELESESDDSQNRKRYKSKKSSLRCFYCARLGHSINECRFKKDADRYQRKRERQDKNANANIVQIEEYARLPHISDSTTL